MDPRRLLSKLDPYLRRLSPKSLGSRLALAIGILSVLGMSLAFTLVRLASTAEFDALAAAAARERLAAFDAFLISEKQSLSADAAALASGFARHDSVSGDSDAWLTERLAASGATVLIRSDAAGRTLRAQGDVSPELLSIASRLPGDDGAGLVWAGRQVMIVSWHAIEETSGPSGQAMLARPLEAALRSRFVPLSNGLTVSLSGPPAVPASGSGSTGAPEPRIRVSQGSAETLVALRGIGGAAAGSADLRIADPRLSPSMAGGSHAAVAAGMLVAILGVAVGSVTGSSLRVPIDRARRHLRMMAPLALEGMPCERMATTRFTPKEFRALASDVDGLLSALSRRQADLVRRTDQARAAGESLRAVLDASPLAMMVIDDDLVTFANPTAAAFLDIPLEQLVGKTPDELFQRASAFLEDGTRLDERIFHPLPEALVTRLECGDRPARWVEVTETLLPSEDHERLLFTARDITEERQLEALREEVFSIVSHDLRGPLTVVQGYLDILERPLEPEAKSRALESARYNARKMSGLLEDLLDAAQGDRLLALKDVERVDLAALVREAVLSVQLTANDHSLEAVVDTSADTCGDARRLRQVLVNLLSNAVKYSPAGTRVTARVGVDGDDAVVWVEDEGPGIPPEEREAVFERYTRLPSSQGKQGLGLGLYIVRIIVANHGGRVSVEKALGGGSRFVVALPLAE